MKKKSRKSKMVSKMIKSCSILCLVFICYTFFATSINAQNITSRLHSTDEYSVQRLSILSDQNIIHTNIRPYRREDMVRVGIDYLKKEAFTDKTKYDIAHIFAQNNEFKDSLIVRSETPLLKHFYKTPAHLFEINTPNFYLKANPALHLGLGTLQNNESNLYINQRGIDLRGGIDHKVYFGIQILESQVRFPEYINALEKKVRAVPRSGLYKFYTLEALGVQRGFDYLVSQAYVGFNITKHIGLQFGHGSNFIGEGQRSLLLSDFSTPYLYLKLNTRVWKFHYQNIFAELSAGGVRDDSGDQRVPRKYLAAHYLSFKPSKKLTLGVYEAVIFSRGRNRFELQYLNPIIFYRTIEGAIGSPDNALLGATINWNAFNKVQFYGQFVLDDIIVRNVFNGNLGWWGNKFGFQFGAKYINAFGIDHLDAQVEVNTVRPYTYAHRDSVSTYSHFNQPLAHPVGANFNEVLFSVKYKPTNKIQLNAKLFLISTGEDFAGETAGYGQNILLKNSSRLRDFGNFIGQGDATDINFLHLSAAYEWRHNLFFELVYGRRNKITESGQGDLNSTFITGAIRWNIPSRPLFF